METQGVIDTALLFLISGPSGSGKSMLIKKLLSTRDDEIRHIPSVTTREPRDGETFGNPYYFVSKEDFFDRVKRGKLAEFEMVYGNYYGILRDSVDSCILGNTYGVTDIDVLGAVKLKRKYFSNVVTVFVAPASLEELERRLVNRSLIETEELSKRLARYEFEMKFSDLFDYVIDSKSKEEDFSKFRAIIYDKILEGE
jgi:guanylate kinase